MDIFSRTYHAKLWHYLFPIVLMAFGTWLVMTPGWTWCGWAIFGVGCVLGVLILPALMIINAKSDEDRALAEYSEQVRGMSPDQMDALGLRVPMVRIKRAGVRIQVCFEDTICTLDNFRIFVENSNDYEIYEERSTSGEARRQWRDLVAWLLSNRYLVPQSAKGSHSYLWYPNKYRQLLAEYKQFIRADIEELVFENAQKEAATLSAGTGEA